MQADADQFPELSPTKRALLALKQLQEKLEALEKSKNEPIAIVGLGCRFPGGADDPEAFWDLLENGRDSISEVPPEHWDLETYYDRDPNAPGKMTTRHGGFIPHLQAFDAQFFRIAPREAMSLDPQQRLLLEVTWEALENAGIAPERLNGSPTGVFIGICGNDYWHHLGSGPWEIDAYLTTGNTHSLASGRISYTLGLTGPSLSVNTACSSSLVAIHLAITSLRNQECDLALVGGVNRILMPEISINFSKARMLSPDGRCKPFDATANGFVRSEGCGMVVIKRLRDAITAGDRILALLYGSAINQDGRTSGLTVPNGLSQQAVIKQALTNSQIEPHQVSYLETHGTGTELGDPLEIGALGAVFGTERSAEQPLILGALKANIGHCEAAAGIASLIKVVLSLQHEMIPPQIHFHSPNPHIDWAHLPLNIPTQLLPWPKGTQRRIAGVSSFGFSGTNAHVVVAEAPPIVAIREQTTERPIHLLTLSAKNEAALKALVARHSTWLTTHSQTAIADVCFSANMGRSHFNHRLAIVTASIAQLQQQLATWLTGQPTEGVFQGQVQCRSARQVAFEFTAGARQAENFVDQLYQTQPTFQRAIKHCHSIIADFLDIALSELLWQAPPSSPQYSDISLFILEYALFILWQSWGIVPAAVIGEDIGEWVAATVAGAFPLEDSLRWLAQQQSFKEAAKAIAIGQLQFPVFSKFAGEIREFPQFRQQFKQPPTLPMTTLPFKSYNTVVTIDGSASTHWSTLISTLAQLYLQGVEVNWSGFEQGYFRQKVVLPTYPFQRTRYWIDG